MICGALQTLNEEAFEDVIGSERPSPTDGGPSGEMMIMNAHHLAPISEQIENDLSYCEDIHCMHYGFAINSQQYQHIHQYNHLSFNSPSTNPLPTVIVIPATGVDDTHL